MRKAIIIVQVVLVIMAVSNMATAQKKNKRLNTDSARVFREFVKMNQFYKKLPLYIEMRLTNTTSVTRNHVDSASSDVTFYYGVRDFYMKGEGMEEILNDSMAVLINHQAKQIRIVPNNQGVLKSLEKGIAVVELDSSINQLMNKYSAIKYEGSSDSTSIILKGRERIYGTDMPKEEIKVVYNKNDYQPIFYWKKSVSLLPVDSAVYEQYRLNMDYEGRLIRVPFGGRKLYFAMKEQVTEYVVKSVRKEIQVCPVMVGDRITKDTNGDYLPVKGYEDYLLSKDY